jgi:hypothetical protein
LLFFSFGGEERLRSLSEATDFRDVEKHQQQFGAPAHSSLDDWITLGSKKPVSFVA